MGIFTHEIVLLDVLFKMRQGLSKSFFRFQRCHPNLSGVSNNVDYFGEYEAIYETVLACESGP
jgi:hypothetical protein